MGFVHLHVHSNFSFGDGACRIDDLVDAARAMGMKALAVTDHEGLYGAVRFYEACQKAGIKPIVGVELTVESVLDADGEPENRPKTPLLPALTTPDLVRPRRSSTRGLTTGARGRPAEVTRRRAAGRWSRAGPRVFKGECGGRGSRRGCGGG